MNHDTTPELIIAAAASKSTWAGVFSMFVGWLVSSNGAVAVGMAVGVAGVLINWYYRREDHKLRAASDSREAELNALLKAAEMREAELDALRKARLQRGMTTDTDLGELEDA